MTQSKDSKSPSKSPEVTVAIITGIFAIIAACLTGVFLIANTIIEKGIAPAPSLAVTMIPPSQIFSPINTSISTGYLPTVTQAPLPTKTLEPINWYVRVYNIDDIGTVYVNDQLIATIGYSEDSGWVDVTSYFLAGTQNRVRFTLKNNETGYRWGFEIKRNELVIWQDREGQINQGARNNDLSSTFQIVYDKTLLINQDGQITEQP
ncbi:MAG: hypothetical protein U0X74_00490 [Anaerolineales bacterium]